jgi:hypothetical protein
MKLVPSSSQMLGEMQTKRVQSMTSSGEAMNAFVDALSDL